MQSGGADSPWRPHLPQEPERGLMTVAFEETQMAEVLHHSLSCSVVISQTHEIC